MNACINGHMTKMLSKWIMNYFLNIEWNESRIKGEKSETNNLECKKIVRPWRNFAMGSTSHVLKWLRKPTLRLAHKFKQAYVPEEFPQFDCRASCLYHDDDIHTWSQRLQQVFFLYSRYYVATCTVTNEIIMPSWVSVQQCFCLKFKQLPANLP